MKYLKGDVLWYMPIRYWEEKEPIKCIVQEDKITHEYSVHGGVPHNESLYVYSEEYNHNVYIDRSSLFFDIDKLRKAIEAYTLLHDLYREDEVGKLCERMWEDKKNEKQTK